MGLTGSGRRESRRVDVLRVEVEGDLRAVLMARSGLPKDARG